MSWNPKKCGMLLLSLAGVLLVAGAEAGSGGAGARGVDEAWKRAIEAGDLEGVVACYAEQATLWLPGAAEAHGRDAIREAYRSLLSANDVSDVTYSRTHYYSGGGLEGGAGDFQLVLNPKSGGSPVRLAGRFSTLVRREAGRWVYDVDHASTGPNP